MTILLAATAVLVVIAVAVLFAPIAVDIRAEKSPDALKIDVAAHLRWLGLDIPIRRKSRRPRTSSKTRGTSSRRMGALLLSPGFLARTAQFVAELAALIPPRRLELDARLGFEDPADTGMLLGWLAARSFSGRRYRIRVEPDFSDNVLAGRLRVFWSTNVATMTWPAIKFASSPVVWRAVRNYRASG